MSAVGVQGQQTDRVQVAFERFKATKQRADLSHLVGQCVVEDKQIVAQIFHQVVGVLQPNADRANDEIRELWIAFARACIAANKPTNAHFALCQLFAVLDEQQIQDPEVWILAGEMFCSGHSISQAISAFSVALSLNPHAPNASELAFRLAKLHRAKGDNFAALQFFWFVRTSLPQHLTMADVQLETAATHIANNQHKAAKRTYARVLQQNPNNSTAFVHLAWIHSQHTDPASQLKATSCIQAAFAAGVRNVMDWIKLARIFRQRRDFPAAFAAARQALILQMTNAVLFCEVGMLYHANQQIRDATSAFTRAVTVDNTRWEAWFNLGMLEYQREQHDAAKTAIHKAFELSTHPTVCSVHAQLSASQPVAFRLIAVDLAKPWAHTRDTELPHIPSTLI